MSVFSRDVSEISLSQLAPRERASLITGTFLCTAAQLCGFIVIEPNLEEFFQKHHGYCGAEQKVIHPEETEVFSLAFPVIDDDQTPAHLRYAGTLVSLGAAQREQMVYRTVCQGAAPDLEGVYRRERYGRLLKDHQPLPTDHLLSFEGPRSLAELRWREGDTSTPQPNSAPLGKSK